MFRVPSAPIIRSTIKTVDAIIGTVHVSVRFKSVERSSLFHRAFLFTNFICSNKCTFFIITPILVSIIKAFKTLKNSYMFRSQLIIFRESPGPC
jgi:hypothetical protein